MLSHPFEAFSTELNDTFIITDQRWRAGVSLSEEASVVPGEIEAQCLASRQRAVRGSPLSLLKARWNLLDPSPLSADRPHGASCPCAVTVEAKHLMLDTFVIQFWCLEYEKRMCVILLQVAGLFRDASIGNAINIVVVRLILLEQDEVNKQQQHTCVWLYK